MARRVLVAAILVLMAASLLPSNALAGERSDYIVVLKSSVNDPGAVAREHARSNGAMVGHVYRHALKGYSASIPEHRLDDVRSDPRVAAVNVDAPVQALGHPAGNSPTGVHRTFAPDNANIDIDGIDDRRVDVDIAIIDTGIDIDHPDLNVVGGKNCQKGTSYDDGNGHGTHVAGSAAGLDNGNGVVGMAPGARLWAVRVLDNSGSGSWSSVICGVDWVSANAATVEVANMSLGGGGSEPSGTGCATGNSLHDAICKSVALGTTYAVAAGNSSVDAKDHVPAAYDEVITVSALADFNGLEGGGAAPTCRTDSDDTFANFSNYGADVDVIAAGVCIRSTWKGGGYNTISGTSMASPHVAGAAALYKSSNGGASPATVKDVLRSAGNLGWNGGDDGDATKEPLLDVSNATTFSPLLVATGATAPTNTAPVATDDSASTMKDNAVTVTVLANDSDADGHALTVTNLTAPAHGSVQLNTDQTVTYTPSAGYTGSDSFTYTAYDGTAYSNTATVSISVTSTPPSGGITLSASSYKVKGFQRVDLSWSGATGTEVDVYRDGSKLMTTSNDGSYTDDPNKKGGGSYTYKVCEAGTSTCSNEATATF